MFQAVFTSFSPYLDIGRTGGRGSPKGLVHNLLMQHLGLRIPKIEVFETCFFDIVIS